MMTRFLLAMGILAVLILTLPTLLYAQQVPIDTALPAALPAPGVVPQAPSSVVVQSAPVQVPSVPVVPPGAPNPPPETPRIVMNGQPQPAAPARPPLTIEELQKMIKVAPQMVGNIPKQIPDLKTIQKDISRAVTPLDPNKFNGENYEKLPWSDSMMFPEIELLRFYNAVKGNLTENVNQQVAVQVKMPKVAPTFYINSVLFEGPDNWTIWLNSRRIRAGTTFPDLEIASVKDDKVELRWKTDQLDYISPNWDQKIKAVDVKPGDPLPEWAYVSADKNVFVDQTRRTVRFFIGPHQSFVTRKMEVVEGKAKSVFFKAATPTAAMPGAPGMISAPGVAGTPGAYPNMNRAVGPGLSRGGQYVPTPVISGGIPGAAPGTPMGSAPMMPQGMPAPTNNSLNPMAMPPTMMAPMPGASPVVGSSPLINNPVPPSQ